MALGFMRRHRDWLKYMLLLVVLAFIILYIPAFQDAGMGDGGQIVARVGDENITVNEFHRMWMAQRQRLTAGGMDPAMLEQMGMRDQVLQALIDRKLVVQEARRLGLTVDDDAVASEIARSPAFQFRGSFMGAEELRRQLALQGRSEEEFTESVREDLMVERLQSLVTDGVRVSDQEAEREFRRRNERVKLEYVFIDAGPFRAQSTATDQEVGARFQAQREGYRIPERRVLGYILLDPTAMQDQAKATDAEVEAFYRDNDRQFQQPEEACARHILVKVKATPAAPGHTEEEARALAQKALDQVRGGADFAEVARKSSEDAGTASQGGDLGCFGPGSMVPEFDQAVFSALQPGQVSELVRTQQHGFHVIQLLSRREQTTRPLAEVKEGIRQLLSGRKVRELAEQKAGQIAQALKGGDSLEEAARAQTLAVQKSAPVGREDRVPPLDSPELMARAFLLRRGQSHPEAFATSKGWVFITLEDVQASRLPELAEVKDRVSADLVEEKARAQALERAREVRARAETDGLDKAAAAAGLLRKETPAPVGRGEPLGELGGTRQLEDTAFALQPQAVSDPVPTPSGYAVLRVLEKTPFDPAAFAQQKASVVSSLEQQRKRQLFQSYVAGARERFKVERYPAAMRRVSS
jgi:peptidyl-prolyl cis-trans isomerase D